MKSSSAQMLTSANISQRRTSCRRRCGGFGELLRENLLAQILPPANYHTQYPFRNGQIVDAVIVLGGGLVPIDSKFPMESFNRVLVAESDEERTSLRRGFLRGHLFRGHLFHCSTPFFQA
jgi:DNA anti-recombination protein RmuC